MRWKAIPDSHSNGGGLLRAGEDRAGVCKRYLWMLPVPSLLSIPISLFLSLSDLVLPSESPRPRGRTIIILHARSECRRTEARRSPLPGGGTTWNCTQQQKQEQQQHYTHVHSKKQRERERERGGSSYNGHSHADMLSLLPSASSHNPLNLLATFARIPPLAGQ